MQKLLAKWDWSRSGTLSRRFGEIERASHLNHAGILPGFSSGLSVFLWSPSPPQTLEIFTHIGRAAREDRLRACSRSLDELDGEQLHPLLRINVLQI